MICIAAIPMLVSPKLGRLSAAWHMEGRAMNEKLSGAIEALLDELREQQMTVLDTKKMINSLRKRIGEPPLFTDADLQDAEVLNPSRPDLYYGKPLATACREYLELRKQACDAGEILKALSDGGFDFEALGWKDRKTWLRLLSISLAKNTYIFHRLPNGTFGLLTWYPEVAKPKLKRNNNIVIEDDKIRDEDGIDEKDSP